MAISGNAITTAYSGRYYEFTWSATQDIATNKSRITWELYAKGGSSAWYAERTLKVVVNGTTLFSKTDRVERYTGKITGGSFSLTHDSTGKCSFTVDLKAAVYYEAVNCTGTKTFTLNQIPRQATLTSAPNFTDAVNPTIKYSNPAGNSVSALEACISLTGAEDDIPYRAVSKTGTSYTFNLTTAELNTLKNATTGNSRTVYFYLKTTIGSNTYYSYLAKTFSISDTSISFDSYAYDINDRTKALTGNSSYIIKGYSDLYFIAGASSASGTISSVSATCGGSTINAIHGTFYGATSASVDITAKDSRGNTASTTVSKYLIGYFKPTFNIDVSPVSASGEITISVDGTFYNGSFGKVMNTITCRYSISHEGSGYSQGSSFDLNISGNNFSGSITLTGLDYKNVYLVSANCYDELEEVQPGEQKAIGEPIFDWDNEEFNFNVPIAMEEDIVLRRNDTNTVLSANGGALYLRPNGDTDTTGEAKLWSTGLADFTDVKTGRIQATNYIWAENYLYAKGTVYGTDGDFTGYVKIGSHKVGEQTFLHTDTGRYMHDTQAINLTGDNRITKQINGYIIIWMRYSNGTVYANDSTYTFIPKVAANFNSGRITLPIAREDGTVVGAKLLFITDDGTTTTITGSSNNDNAPNNGFVLKHIISW